MLAERKDGVAMVCGAICGGDDEVGPWERVIDKKPEWRGTHVAYVGCCNRLAPVEDVESQWYVAYGGYVGGRRARCAPHAGCNVNTGYKRTAHLREYEIDESPFYQK